MYLNGNIEDLEKPKLMAIQLKRNIILKITAYTYGREHIWTAEMEAIEKDNHETDHELYCAGCSFCQPN